ncbi:hypothetical protein [Nocardia aobensis]|nr:hypothetical protein [Nocardia aobensis]
MRLVNWLVTDVCGVPTPPTGGPVNAFYWRLLDGDLHAQYPDI